MIDKIREIEIEELELERLEISLKEKQELLRTKKDEHFNDIISNKSEDNRYDVLEYNIQNSYKTQRILTKKNNEFWSGYNHNSFFNMMGYQKESTLMDNYVGEQILLEALREYLQTNKELEISSNVTFEVDKYNNVKQSIFNKEKEKEKRDKSNKDIFFQQLYIASGKKEGLKPDEEEEEFTKVVMDTWAYSLGQGEIKKETIIEALVKYLEDTIVHGGIEKVILYNLYIRPEDNGPSGKYNKLYFRLKHLHKLN